MQINSSSPRPPWSWDVGVVHHQVSIAPGENNASETVTWEEEVSMFDDERGYGSHYKQTQTVVEFLREGPLPQAPVAIVESMLEYLEAGKPAWFDPYRLQIAASDRNLAEVRSLLEQGVNADTPVQRLTPFYCAIQSGDLEIAETIFAAGIDVSRQFPGKGGTALIALIEHAPDESWEPLAKRMIAQGAPLEARDANGETALISAAYRAFRLPGLPAALLAAGADVNARSKHDTTALIEATGYSPLVILDQLLSAGANVNARDSQGRSALMWAISRKRLEIVQRLIEAGADVHAVSEPEGTAESGKTVLQWAIDYGQPEILALIREAVAA